MTVTAFAPPPVATSCCPVDAALAGTSAADLRAATFAEFLYGRGDAPGLDLGRSLGYTRSGTVYRHEFERGVTLANVGTEPVDVALGRGYLDLDYVLRRYVVLPPHSAEVLLSCGR
jgi:hypothetical protein